MPSPLGDWNDLKLVLAVGRSGSLSRAADQLRINHSTAFRKLKALEDRLGARLFERLPGGVYVPTPAGLRVANTAERVETETDGLDRDLVGADARLTGQLRVTSSETLAFSLLTRCISEFRRVHPGVVVDLAVDNRVLSLSRREADVALRVTRPKEGDLYGRKLTDVSWAIYGRRDVVATLAGRTLDELRDQPFIAWEETTGIISVDWVARNVPDHSIVFRTSSVVNQYVAVREGLGLAALPCYLGDADPLLARAVDEPIAEDTRELWIVTHSDLKRTARVKAFFKVVGDRLISERPLIMGLRPQATIHDRSSDRNRTPPVAEAPEDAS